MLKASLYVDAFRVTPCTEGYERLELGKVWGNILYTATERLVPPVSANVGVRASKNLMVFVFTSVR
jgi:hypothetical protein